MPSLADSLVSSSARSLPMRKRPDLSAEKHRYQGRAYWVVKEPVGLQYFRFQEEEYAILNMLDGKTSLDGIKSQFERDFPPQKITVEELGQFVGMLHRSGLVIADVPGQGYQLKKRRDEKKWKEFLAAASNILAVRFKGIDPERILNWLAPKLSWVFTRWGFAAWLCLVVSALLLVAVNFHTFRAKLPAFHEFFTGWNWIYLGGTLAITKVIHEFGHGTSCKHYGGECHEMGVMLLVLTPCLYCNVSDSWMLPNKWHRAIIGAAGMYVELFLASLATWIWWFTHPGTLNQICLSTMFVCSVSTVIFNGNPLLRYDGYYILADLIEIPNLRQKSSSICSRMATKWCLGMEQPEDPFLPQRNHLLFAAYTIAAVIYRWVVLFSILWFMYHVLEPYGLKVISQILAAFSLVGVVVIPLYKLGKFFWVPGRIDQVKGKNLRWTLVALGAVVAFVGLVPLPHTLVCPLEIKARDAASVYVHVAGQLEKQFVKPGDAVEAGQPLVELVNHDLDVHIADVESRLAQTKARLQALLRQRSQEVAPGDEIRETQKLIKSYQEQLDQLMQDRGRLTLKAPVSGTVLAVDDMPASPADSGQLPTWSGSVFEPQNLGATLQPSTPVCYIGQPQQLEAVLVVDQNDVELVAPGDAVKMQIDLLPGERFGGQVDEISEQDVNVIRKRFTFKAQGELPTKTDEHTGVDRPIAPAYQLRVNVDDSTGQLMIGTRGRARISLRWMTLWERTYRLLMHTFNFKL